MQYFPVGKIKPKQFKMEKPYRFLTDMAHLHQQFDIFSPLSSNLDVNNKFHLVNRKGYSNTQKMKTNSKQAGWGCWCSIFLKLGQLIFRYQWSQREISSLCLIGNARILQQIHNRESDAEKSIFLMGPGISIYTFSKVWVFLFHHFPVLWDT